MNRLFLAASVALIAISAPAAAEKGGKGGHGGGGQAMNHGGGGHAAKMDRGGGGHGPAMKAHNGGGSKGFRAEHGGGFKAARLDRGSQRFAFRSDREGRKAHGKAERHADRGDRMHGGFKPARVERFAERRRDFDRKMDRQARREVLASRDWKDGVRVAERRDWDDFDRWENVRSRAYGCPPGLAAKNNGCLPPGQAKKLIGNRIPAAYASAYLPDSLRSYYRDNDDYYYRYGDGYVYRVNRDNNLISSLLPLFGGSYGLGQAFPLASAGYRVPSYYDAFYQDSPYSAYRYDNGYMYQIDPRTGLVEDVYPTLGYGYGVGEMLPAGYSAYNVPYQYRDVYYDTPDAYYRYAPGAIYQVDPQTNLITSVASLLTGQPLGVGQALPMGYDAYNVPYAYRDRYYDSNDAWYRYANGNIYQVDPTTRLITAVIDAIV